MIEPSQTGSRQMLENRRVILDSPGDPAANMARDEEIAAQVRAGTAGPTLRIYRWSRPAISLGHRQDLDELPAALLERKLPIVRRPTGGGAVLHRPDELTYALALPRNPSMPADPLRQIPGILHRNLRDELVRRWLVSPEDLQLVETQPITRHCAESATFSLLGAGCGGRRSRLTLCFESPVGGDLLYRGRKVAGSALRVWREALLIQGSIQDLPVAQGALSRALLEAVAAGLGTVSSTLRAPAL